MNKLLMALLVAATMMMMGCEFEGPDGSVGPAGPAGEDGSDGADGQDGMDGADGTDGEDAASTVDLGPGCHFDLAAENFGEFYVCCSAGGTARALNDRGNNPTDDGVFSVYDIQCHADSEGECSLPSQCGDGIADVDDNCPDIHNSDQADADGDGIGDACDEDVDGDGIADAVDLCVNEPGFAVSFACDEEKGFVGFQCDTDAVKGLCYEYDVEDCENNECVDSNGVLIQWTAVNCSRHGCDDTDTDGDGFRDLDDACPSDAEDHTVDSDGCPDTDGDGLDDDEDSCPAKPEDVDEIADDDGCPEQDADSDGVLDHVDQCPLTPEDLDGFEDTDGCPEDGSL